MPSHSRLALGIAAPGLPGARILDRRVPTMTYLGFDILALDYNRTGPFEETSRRKFVLAGGIGKRWADEQSAAPAPGRPFTWTAFGRQEIWELLAFVDARKGRAVPFWMPSLQPDLSLSADFSPGASLATIRWIRYAQQMFGTTGARRHLALWTLGNPIFDLVVPEDPQYPCLIQDRRGDLQEWIASAATVKKATARA